MKVVPDESVVDHTEKDEPSKVEVQVYEIETVLNEGLLEDTVTVDPSIVEVL